MLNFTPLHNISPARLAPSDCPARATHVGSRHEPFQHVGHALAVHPSGRVPLLRDLDVAELVVAGVLVEVEACLAAAWEAGRPPGPGEDLEAAHGSLVGERERGDGRDHDVLLSELGIGDREVDLRREADLARGGLEWPRLR